MASPQSLPGILQFLHQAEGLKTLLRHSWLSDGRQESVAEHTWRMALMALVLHEKLEDKVDLGHVLQMILIHDLAEVVAGDHHAWKGELKNKHDLEEKGLKEIVAPLAPESTQELLDLWQEFEQATTPEAKFAQALDKLEVLIQHNEADLSTWNEKEKAFSLTYGTDTVAHSDLLTSLRKLVKAESEAKLA